MIPLTSDGILTMKKLVQEGTQECPLYAVEHEGVVVVTNNSVLLAWPTELVEYCPRLSKLFDASEHKMAVHNASRMRERHWTEVVLQQKNRVVRSEEVDPEDHEVDVVVYEYGMVRVPYHWSHVEVMELFLEEPDYEMITLKDNYTMYPMIAYDRGVLVGAFVNNRVD